MAGGHWQHIPYCDSSHVCLCLVTSMCYPESILFPLLVFCSVTVSFSKHNSTAILILPFHTNQFGARDKQQKHHCKGRKKEECIHTKYTLQNYRWTAIYFLFSDQHSTQNEHLNDTLTKQPRSLLFYVWMAMAITHEPFSTVICLAVPINHPKPLGQQSLTYVPLDTYMYPTSDAILLHSFKQTWLPNPKTWVYMFHKILRKGGMG